MTTDERPPSQLPRHLLFAVVALGIFASVIAGAALGTPAGDKLMEFGGLAGLGAVIAFIITSD
jgi:hypothetical protein